MYVDDSGGKLISYYQTTPNNTQLSTLWIARLQTNYTAYQNIRCCPATTPPSPVTSWKAPKDDPLAWGTADYPWLWDPNGMVANDEWVGSYGLNGWCYGDGYKEDFGPENEFFLKQSGISHPALTPYFSDSIWVDGWPLATDTPATDLYAGSDNNIGIDRLTISRHNYKSAGAAPRSVPAGQPLPGSINIAFVDGHAAPVRLEDLWTLYWHVNWVVPGTRPR